MTTVTQSSAVQPAARTAVRWLPLAVLMAGTFMAVLDSTFPPVIQRIPGQ